jgi:hypothetical protein
MSRPELLLNNDLKVEAKNFCLALFVGWNPAPAGLIGTTAEVNNVKPPLAAISYTLANHYFYPTL